MAKHLTGWTVKQKEELRQLVLKGDRTYKQIAEKLDRNPGAVRYFSIKMGLPRPAASDLFRGRWNIRHSHLRRPVFEYFLSHSWDETQKRFGLTNSELKSLFSSGYRDPKLAHLRKDTRVKKPFTLEDWLFLLRYAGIRERGWIAKKMGRSVDGRFHSVKDRVKLSGGGTIKFLNGMPLSWAKEFWPGVEFDTVHTQAGPFGKRGEFRFKLIPWVEALRISRIYKTDQTVVRCIRAMAKFQCFIHGMKSRPKIINRLKKQAKDK